MYACEKCSQIHVKPNYSSVSVYVPWDLNIDKGFLLTCVGCGDQKKFSKFKFMGIWEPPIELLPDWLTGRRPSFVERIFGRKSATLSSEPPYPFIRR